MKKNFFLWAVIGSLALVSCKKQTAHEQEPPVITETPLSNPDQLRIEFAQTLAKAIANPVVRKLIREEALKQFDNDYDVLWYNIQHREISPGVTFSEYLTSLASGRTPWDNLQETLPLLTVLVPNLSHFSAAAWQTENQLPVVAVVNSTFDEKHTQLPAFDHNGNQLFLAPDKEPAMPVIVVKENERVIAKAKTSAGNRADKSNFVFENTSNDFYFMDDSFNPEKNPLSTGEKLPLPKIWTDSRLADAYSLGAASQRDYVYYGILNSTDQGPLKTDYAEYIYAIAVEPVSNSYVDDDPVTDWADGALEFQVDVIFFNGTSALDKVTKVLGVPDTHLNGYYLPTPLKIDTWDMQSNGDTWKYVVTEIDPGTVTTVTQVNTSKFGANFTFSTTLGKVVKLGLGFGLTGEISHSSTVQTQVTTGSDVCGEAVVRFVQPLITGSGKIGPIPIFWVEELNTGVVRLIVAPKKIGT